MRLSTGAFFGLALAAAFWFSAPASAIETQPGAQAAQASEATPVYWRGRCFRWKAYCHNKYPASNWRYRRCLAIHACFRK